MKLSHPLVWAPVMAFACSAEPPLEPDLGPSHITTKSPAATEASAPAADEINPRILRRFKPLAALAVSSPTETAQIDLGRMLFFDKRMSHNRDLSCNSCHRLDKYGVDNEPTSIGAEGKRGRRNSPTVYHASANLASFWDGRARDVEEQAKGPIINPAEMAMADPKTVVTLLGTMPGYVTAFTKAFPQEPSPVTYDNVGKAIGAFERRLVTPSRWDRYLEGDRSALTRDEVAGFKLFADVGCMTCHTGELVGGSMFQKAGFAKPWPNQADQGRFEITKLDADRMMFKVPSLRNVAKTAPYFHDGTAKTLPEAVAMMSNHQIEDSLKPDEVRSIVTWLETLTGEIPETYIREPQLPADH